MIAWIAALNLFMNFCYGAMIVVMPQLSLESAGLAYSAFFFFKAAWYFVSGQTDHRLGSSLSVGLSLALQAAALFAIFRFPEVPWAGRVLEGVALAQGTVSSLSVLRLVARTPEAFSKAIGWVLGLGSLGYVVGPVVAFLIAKESLFVFGMILSALSLLLAAAWGVSQRARIPNVPAPAGVDNTSLWSSSLLWPVLAVASIKSVVMGLQLNLGWWARETMGLTPIWAGVSFIVLSVLFAVGAGASRRVTPLAMALVGPLAYILLEMALSGVPALWWLSLALIGTWYGFSISTFYGRLGWNDSANMGRQNATWLFVADAPMAILPILVWPTRLEIYSPGRLALVGGLLALSLLSYWQTFGWGFRVPTQSSQS